MNVNIVYTQFTPPPSDMQHPYFIQRYQMLLNGNRDRVALTKLPEDYEKIPWQDEHHFYEVVMQKFSNDPEILSLAFHYPHLLDLHLLMKFNARGKQIQDLWIANYRDRIKYWLVWCELSDIELSRMVPYLLNEIKHSPKIDDELAAIKQAIDIHNSKSAIKLPFEATIEKWRAIKK